MQARRRRRGQNPKPYQENERWKFKYRIDQAQADGQVRRAQRTKVLGRLDEMTFSEACREVRKFVQPIDDLRPGIEFSSRTVRDLIQKWRRTVGRTLRPSTQRSYEWALKRIEPRFGNQQVSHLAKEDVESFSDRRSNGRTFVRVRRDSETKVEGPFFARGRLGMDLGLPRKRAISPRYTPQGPTQNDPHSRPDRNPGGSVATAVRHTGKASCIYRTPERRTGWSAMARRQGRVCHRLSYGRQGPRGAG